MIPILVRCKNRVNYLHTTLKSLTATNLKNSLIIIADDCSDSDEMNRYLFSNEYFSIDEFSWYSDIRNEIKEHGSIYKKDLNILTNKEIWDKYVGNVPEEINIKGIKDKFNIIQPSKSMGVKGGLFWTIFAGFTLFKNAERIVIIEDDLIFNKNWLNICDIIYNKESCSNLGVISVYNRENENLFNSLLYKETPQIGGVMYMIPRTVFNRLKSDKIFEIDFSKTNNIGGDSYFLDWLAKSKLKVLNSSTSYIQHIGIKSLARPGRFLRYSKNFLQPYAWNKDFDK